MRKQVHYHDAAVAHLKSSYFVFLFVSYFSLESLRRSRADFHSVICTVSKLHGHHEPARGRICYVLKSGHERHEGSEFASSRADVRSANTF